MKQSRIVFQTEWFSIEQESFDNIEFLKGKPYYRINSPDGVMILAVTEKTEIVLFEQFPAFAPIVLAAWKYGDNILTSL